jgi:hypothetical protein
MVNLAASDTLQSAVVFLVFKNINSTMQRYYLGNGKDIRFSQLPAGHQARVVVFSVNGKNIVAGSTDVQLGKNETVNLFLKPMNEQELSGILN